MRRHHLVLAIIALVAAYDIVTGARLLLSPAPHLVNGIDTLWARAVPALAGPGSHPDAHLLIASLFRRLGAFSLHSASSPPSGRSSRRRHPQLITVLLIQLSGHGGRLLLHRRSVLRRDHLFRDQAGTGPAMGARARAAPQ